MPLQSKLRLKWGISSHSVMTLVWAALNAHNRIIVPLNDTLVGKVGSSSASVGPAKENVHHWRVPLFPELSMRSIRSIFRENGLTQQRLTGTRNEATNVSDVLSPPYCSIWMIEWLRCTSDHLTQTVGTFIVPIRFEGGDILLEGRAWLFRMN